MSYTDVMGFTVKYAGLPLITWEDGRIDGDPHAVDYVKRRVAQGGMVPGTAINSALPVGLAEPAQAYATIYNALLGTVWGGMITVEGDISGPASDAEPDPHLIY